MTSLFTRLFIVVIVFSACSGPQKLSKTEPTTIDNLKSHIQYLADDKLEGRRTGTEGERLAMEYIIDQFKKIGLSPKGTEYYPQNFIVNDGKEMGATSELSVNGNKLEVGKHFFIYPFSPDKYLDASATIAVHESAAPWFIDLGEVLEENKSNPHFDLSAFTRSNSIAAKEKGATAVIYYNSSSADDQQSFDAKDKSESLSIPVIYITKQAPGNIFNNKQATLTVKLRTAINQKNRVGHNVIGFINNGAPTTVVLGAHYDHLGYGEDGNSMIRTGERNIHNGADDNASGTASLIELARILKKSNAKKNNYLFIAFSGEELGLFGSKYFVENPTIDIKTVNYMINLDMVGRLNDSSKVLTIGGYGTSPAWGNVITKGTSSLVIRIDSSGTGPSDHTSFYRKDIPVLFYFTGLHTDYHKPSDDANKINYEGANLIINHITSVIESMDRNEKLVFTKTREAQTTTSARFSVSLGVMPDYTYSGTGLRTDGVSEGKPAQKAGLKAGDIIIQLGDYTISSMETYMQALGKFKKGEKTKVKFKRGEETMEAAIEF